MLQTFTENGWDAHYPDSTQQQAIQMLEHGQILYFPQLSFALLPHEQFLLSPQYADPGSKNISYHAERQKLWGVQRLTDAERLQLVGLLERFSRSAQKLIRELLPPYASQLMLARTSFRPLEISQRQTSYRKDDKRLHIDAFPSAPNQGKRILRVFCNINPENQNRVWRIGESFEKVANRFLPKIQKPLPGLATSLRLLKITKSYRTLYDHYMLQIHNNMKADEQYQKEAEQQVVNFPAGCTWIAQTDHVSHAAMSGQYVLEQTFYLPIHAMKDESLSPLRILERMLNQPLV